MYALACFCTLSFHFVFPSLIVYLLQRESGLEKCLLRRVYVIKGYILLITKDLDFFVLCL